jgi:hypothetical protein
MTRLSVLVLLIALMMFGPRVSTAFVETGSDNNVVTFNRDVLPILQEHCQACHRPGQIAPMSFMNYESTRPWAKAIKAAVINGKMPPWLAEPGYKTLRNAPKLTPADIATLAAWADSGAIEGNPADAVRPSVEWPDGWRIPPDVIVSMPDARQIAAKGEGEVAEFTVPSPFEEDTWVSSIEVLPGDASVVHHVIVQMQNKFLANTACSDCGQDRFVSRGSGGGYSRGFREEVPRFSEVSPEETDDEAFMTMEAVYAPGSSPIDLRATNSARLIPGGVPIRIEMHYTPNGKATSDQTKVGFTLAKAPSTRQFVIMAPVNMADTGESIPAGEANWETTGELTFRQDAELAWFMPHMHLRGKDMKFQVLHRNGGLETLLNARFNFNWQLGYELEMPVGVKKGERMLVTAHHDNSANNPANPTPTKAVGWGELTSEEMMLPWFGVIVKGNAKPSQIASYRPVR